MCRKQGDRAIGIVPDCAFGQISRLTAGEITAADIQRHHRELARERDVQSAAEDPGLGVVALVLRAGERLALVLTCASHRGARCETQHTNSHVAVGADAAGGKHQLWAERRPENRVRGHDLETCASAEHRAGRDSLAAVLQTADICTQAQRTCRVEPEESVKVAAKTVVDVVRELTARGRHEEPATDGETGRLFEANCRTCCDLCFERRDKKWRRCGAGQCGNAAEYRLTNNSHKFSGLCYSRAKAWLMPRARDSYMMIRQRLSIVSSVPRDCSDRTA